MERRDNNRKWQKSTHRNMVYNVGATVVAVERGNGKWARVGDLGVNDTPVFLLNEYVVELNFCEIILN